MATISISCASYPIVRWRSQQLYMAEMFCSLNQIFTLRKPTTLCAFVCFRKISDAQMREISLPCESYSWPTLVAYLSTQCLQWVNHP